MINAKKSFRNFNPKWAAAISLALCLPFVFAATTAAFFRKSSHSVLPNPRVGFRCAVSGES
jgi:hypothetical protein